MNRQLLLIFGITRPTKKILDASLRTSTLRWRRQVEMLFQHKAAVCCDKAEWNFNSTFVPSLAQFCDTKNAREKSVLYETTMAVVLLLRQNTMDAVYGWLKEATSRTKELLMVFQ